ncbi:hypothetical protein [Aurantiacibacter marinus]|uniref:Uncharacterized protein n=1 Tax=Aurantiacibacter marinus TaxID=874156 RepID=A0A0H0XN18_9SPHN|nr:hypothetical protein [Aurantiacibacter marinus]KLI63764.1 hypothetical protein AAV99_08585 [Aurantiacibacter marinus]
MAQLSKPPIPLKMYKHFAMATISLTAGIAMFADSDNRHAVSNHIEEREQNARLQQASAEITTPRELIRRDRGTQGTFGDEAGISGSPTVTPRSSNSGSFAPPQTGRRSAVAGYEQAFIDGMSEAEYRAFLAALPPQMRGADANDAEQRAAIEAASARRSGRRGIGADAPG